MVQLRLTFIDKQVFLRTVVFSLDMSYFCSSRKFASILKYMNEQVAKDQVDAAHMNQNTLRMRQHSGLSQKSFFAIFEIFFKGQETWFSRHFRQF